MKEKFHDPITSDDFSNYIKNEKFDFIDLGCSKGGSILFGKQALGGKRGLGIDCNQSKVEQARLAGFDAVNFNIHDIPDEKLVRFVILSHFLEHVPEMSEVYEFVKKACSIASEFVYIQQPYFDSDGYLARQGLKLFWSDWRGHPNRMTSLETWILLRNLRESGLDIDYSIHFHHQISSSTDKRIHRIDSPIDQHEYIEGLHPDKGAPLKFTEPVFAELRALITLTGVDHSQIKGMIKSGYTLVHGRDEILNKTTYLGKPKIPRPQNKSGLLNRFFKIVHNAVRPKS